MQKSSCYSNYYLLSVISKAREVMFLDYFTLGCVSFLTYIQFQIVKLQSKALSTNGTVPVMRFELLTSLSTET